MFIYKEIHLNKHSLQHMATNKFWVPRRKSNGKIGRESTLQQIMLTLNHVSSVKHLTQLARTNRFAFCWPVDRRFLWVVLKLHRSQGITGFSSGTFYSHPISSTRMCYRPSPSCSRILFSCNFPSLEPAIPPSRNPSAFYCSYCRNTCQLGTCNSRRRNAWFQRVVCAW